MANNDARYYVVVTPFFPDGGNFRGAFIHDQIKAIRRQRDYEIVVYRPVPFWAALPEDYIYDGFSVRWFKAALTPSFLFSGIFNGINSRLFKRPLQRDGITPDSIAAVHCHTAACGCYGLQLKRANPGLRLLLQHHDPDPYNIRNGRYSGWLPNLWVRATANKRMFPKFDSHLCVSALVKRNLDDFPNYAGPSADYAAKAGRLKKNGFIGVAGLNSNVFYNGVDVNIYTPAKKKAASGTLNIGSVGNFTDIKDQITLIKAVEILRDREPDIDVKAIFVGSGPTLAECKDYVVSHGLEDCCEFLHEVAHAALPEFYRSIDLFCLPSVFEGFGCVFTEAYACGTPYIICEGQGATEYIPEEERELWTITPYDAEGLARKIANFARTRPEQHLRYPYDIDTLVGAFLSREGL